MTERTEKHYQQNDERLQMPANGCANCGAHAGETQNRMSKALKWDGSAWLCADCMEVAK